MKQSLQLHLLSCLFIILLFLFPAVQEDPFNFKILLFGLILVLEELFLYGAIVFFRPTIDSLLILFYCIFNAVGISTLIKIDFNLASKQLVYCSIGFLVLLIILLVCQDFTWLTKFKFLYGILAIVLCASPILFGISLGGAKNWVSLGGITVQPSEFARVLLVLYFASELRDKQYSRFTTDLREFFRPLLITGVCICLLVKQNDLGTALLVFLLLVVIVFVTSSKTFYPLFAITCIILAGFLTFSYVPHFRTRVQSWRDPWSCAESEGFQVTQGFYAMSSGGLIGSDYQDVRPNYVPVCESDYIFTIVCEEHGALFCIGLIVLSFLIFTRGLLNVLSISHSFYRLCVVGFMTNYLLNVLLILGGILSVVPLTGVTYPLLSSGGSSLFVTMVSLGLTSKFSESTEVM